MALMIDIRSSLSFTLDQENVNTDTFITSFETIHLAQTMLTNFINCYLNYIIIGSNLGL